MNFEIKQILIDSIPILAVTGYFSEETGKKMDQIVTDLLQKDYKHIIIDFSNCKIVNSPGVAALVEIAMKTVDDFDGKLIIFGIDTLKESVFFMAGIFSLVSLAQTQEEAIKKIKKDQNSSK
ncbi:MAG: STAS domain-containing protein [Candidatus Riflebacteria bacterium]|nr:STAS domain-containing protein [Candidatus Riflebacteria bacterium]